MENIFPHGLSRSALLVAYLYVLAHCFACNDGRPSGEENEDAINNGDPSLEDQSSLLGASGITGSFDYDTRSTPSPSLTNNAGDVALNIDAGAMTSAKGDIYLCGDGIIEGNEECEPEDLAGQTCESLGQGHGFLSCHPVTCRFDYSRCSAAPICGDGVVEGDEQCELEDLAGQTCESLGQGKGVLSCIPETCRFDRSRCYFDPICGDGIVEGDEECEPGDLAGQTCESLGQGFGVLSCHPETCRFDRTACNSASPVYCGDGIVDADEECDGTNMDGATCETLGFYNGLLRCDTSCSFDVTQCESVSTTCGNGVIEPEEQCEGINLNGMTCLALGYAGGSLFCDMTTCSLDTSQCVRQPCFRGWCYINNSRL